MGIVGSGELSMSVIGAELGFTAGTIVSLSGVSSLAGKTDPAGMSEFYNYSGLTVSITILNFLSGATSPANWCSGTATITVTTYSTNVWTATDALTWTTITPGGRTGSGTVVITVSQNLGALRSGDITIAGSEPTHMTVLVSQQGTGTVCV